MRYRYLPYTDKSGGDSPGQLICRLWHGIASQFSGQNIYLLNRFIGIQRIYGACTCPVLSIKVKMSGFPWRTDFYMYKYSRWGYVWHIKRYGCVVVYYSMPHNDQ